MDIGEAVRNMRHNGVKVAREGWNGRGMFLFYVDRGENGNCATEYSRQSIYQDHLGFIGEYAELPWIAMKTAQDTVVPWLCSQTDLLAEDWQLVE